MICREYERSDGKNKAYEARKPSSASLFASLATSLVVKPILAASSSSRMLGGT